jgi:hypothetical protein
VRGVDAVGEVIHHAGNDSSVADVSGCHDRDGDDLAPRVDPDTTLATVETSSRDLLPAATLPPDSPHHPIGDHPPGDTQHPVIANIDIPADHPGRQLARNDHLTIALPIPESRQRTPGVLGPRVDQHLTPRPVVPVEP